MKTILRNHLLIALGWLFVVLGAIGTALPVLPTTPFLILALALFSKSSPRFHRMLLNNRWFGPTLQQWEETKTLSRTAKYKAFVAIVFVFAISVAVLNNNVALQLSLIAIGVVLIVFIWRIKEPVKNPEVRSQKSE